MVGFSCLASDATVLSMVQSGCGAAPLVYSDGAVSAVSACMVQSGCGAATLVYRDATVVGMAQLVRSRGVVQHPLFTDAGMD